MARKLQVVGDAPPPSPNAADALEAAAKKAIADGVTVFLLTYQVADEPIASLSFPPAAGFQQWFCAEAHDEIHGLNNPETPVFIIEHQED